MREKFGIPLFLKKRVNSSKPKSENWFKNNSEKFTFWSTIITGLVFISSIIFSIISLEKTIDSLSLTKESLEQTKKQLILSTKEFNAAREQKSKDEKKDAENERKYAHQDSLNKMQLKIFEIQSSIFAQQLFGLKQGLEIFRASTQGNLILTAIDTTKNEGYVSFMFFNFGHRDCIIRSYGFSFYNPNTDSFVPFIRNQNRFFITPNSGSELKAFVPKSFFKVAGTIIYIEFVAYEAISKKNVVNPYYYKNTISNNGLIGLEEITDGEKKWYLKKMIDFNNSHKKLIDSKRLR